MKKNKRKIYIFIMLFTMIFNLFVGENIVGVEATEVSRVSLIDGVIVDIAAGTDHNLALDQQGNLWAWGRNDCGQVGNGTTIDQLTPVQIMRGHKFKKISAGNALSAAIDENGYLYVWGKESNVSESNIAPTIISTDYSVQNVSVGDDYINFSTTTSDYLFYGYNSISLKDGSSDSNYNEKSATIMEENAPSISVNGFDYRVLDLPSNSGYLSFYTTLDYVNKQSNIKIKSMDGFSKFVGYDDMASYYNSGSASLIAMTFIICEDGSVIRYFCNKQRSYTTVQYSGSKTTNIDDSNSMNLYSVDWENLNDIYVINCAVRKYISPTESTVFFVSEEGKIYTVGSNGNYNLFGNNDYLSTASSSAFVEVQSDAKFVKVSAGQNHVLAVDENGKVYSWGSNAYGQLGHNDTDNRTIPTMIKTFDETKSFNFNAFSNEVFSNTFYQYGGNNYLVVENGSKGTFNINKDSGEFTYIPNENEYGEDTALISVSYNGVVVNYQVNVYIDRKPVFTGGTPSFNVECGQSYMGVAPASDPDNHNLTYSIVKQPLKGEVVLNNNAGSFTYTASNDLAGNDSFILGVSDGYCVIEYPFNVHIQSLISYDDETTINLDLLNTTVYSSNINAKDIDGDSLSYSISKLPIKGNITIDNEGNYTYTADGDKYGEDTFTIKIDDGYKLLEVKYTVNLYSVSDNGTTLAKTITQGTSYSDVIKTNANGVSPTYTIKTQPKNGNVVIDYETGEYTYTPNVGSVGEDSFDVLVDYTYGQYVLTINIYQNTIPNNSSILLDIVTNENTNFTGSAACVDIDGDALVYSIKTKPLKGSVSINPTTGEYTYYPNKNVAGDDSFEILVNDGTDSIIININVHIESLVAIENTINKTISQNTSLSSGINASDKDGDILNYSISTNPINGIANIDSLTGEYTYIPNNNYYGNDCFTIKVDDGVNAQFVTINININRRPITDQISINLETDGITVTGSAKCSDPDGDNLTYSLGANPSQGSVIVNSLTGAFAYTPNSDAAGDDTFTIVTSDGCDDVIVNVTVHNETELNINTSNTVINVNQGKSTNGNVDANDLDNDVLTYSVETHPTQGALNLNSNTGAWTYNASSSASGTDSFTISVTDGNVSKTITYSLLINTPSIIDEDTSKNIVVDNNSSYNGQIIATDEDGDNLIYLIVSQGEKGTVTIDETTGRYIYIPLNNASGNDSFVVGVNDGVFITEVVINVHIESDIEVSQGIITSNVDKGGIVTGKLSVDDPDGDILTYSIYQQGEKGNANITSDGSWSYFANDGAGTDCFVISISDGIHTKYVTIYVHVSTKPIFEESNVTINVSEGSSTNGQFHGKDEDGDSLTYSIISQPENGTVVLNSQTGEYTYKAFTNSDAKEDFFAVFVTDGNNTATLTVRVVINNSPNVEDSNIVVNQGGSVSGNIVVNDPEGDKITYNVGIQGNKGTVTINSTTGEYTYIINDKNNLGVDSFTIVVSDGFNTKEVVVNVTINKNKSPSIIENEIVINSNSTYSGKIESTDLENDEITYSVTYLGNKGTVVIDEKTGEYKYTSNKNTSGYDCFIVTLNDGFNEVSYLVEVNINYVNSNNIWAIPLNIVMSVIFLSSIGALIFVLIKKKKN